jgi:hypothetical protein
MALGFWPPHLVAITRDAPLFDTPARSGHSSILTIIAYFPLQVLKKLQRDFEAYTYSPGLQVKMEKVNQFF